MKLRHQEVLNQFEFDCRQQEKRAIAAEQLAQNRLDEFQDLESKQNLSLADYRQLAETEKKIMEQKLDQLEAKLCEQQLIMEEERSKRLSKNLSISSGLDDTLSYEQQIDFLNSVIVDMQRKNDELANRVQVLEEIGK